MLINNAGIYNDRGNCKPEDEVLPRRLNHTPLRAAARYAAAGHDSGGERKGPLVVSEAFYENVKKSKLKKIVAISSSNGTLTGEKPPRAGAMFYRTSKAALNRAMQIVAASTRDEGVTVLMLNPGPTLTEHQSYLKNNPIMLKTSFTVENMMKTIDKATIKQTGSFLRYDGQVEPW